MMEETAILTREEVSRISSLEDLLTFFKVDTQRFEVVSFKVNKWEQASGNEQSGITITPLYQVRATLAPRRTEFIAAMEQVRLDLLADMDSHIGPTYTGPDEDDTAAEFVVGMGQGPRVLYEVAIMDAHLGMLAWGEETGQSYDLDIAAADFRHAANYHVQLARDAYGAERILFLVGNDLFHIDGMVDGKIGTTTAGTPQDFDSRLPKLFRTARQVVVDALDQARLVAPVDVVMVPGNHDEFTVFRFGEVLEAWYRKDNRVTVLNDPTRRKYYRYGKNLLGLTHGMEASRKRDPLPLIMATEAPELWAKTTHREWHVGHFHSAKEMHYMAPAPVLEEHRGVRVRVLPGLTASDAWHKNEGYAHTRAATGVAWDHDGGIIGLHEHYPRRA
jgi:hypothetical protein